MNGHNRLIRRNHTYYIRARIPVALVYLVHRQEFQYSLQTNNYYEAIAKLSKESHKIDVKINILKAINMLIKNNQLMITEADIDKMVKHKLRQAEEVFENNDWDNGNDCRMVSQKIHNLPKKWTERYKGQKLKDILARDNTDVISLTSVKKYLRVFKEFLEFCKVNQYINDSFQSLITISRRKEAVEVQAFTKDELKKIFDPKTYPRVMDKKYAYRYWIPLLALFHPVRLNEICQLYIEDVRLDKGVWYLNLTDERKDQHLKNPQSRRR